MRVIGRVEWTTVTLRLSLLVGKRLRTSRNNAFRVVVHMVVVVVITSPSVGLASKALFVHPGVKLVNDIFGYPGIVLRSGLAKR
jgi:hypothetical protein